VRAADGGGSVRTAVLMGEPGPYPYILILIEFLKNTFMSVTVRRAGYGLAAALV
jgi:hypothetical protein